MDCDGGLSPLRSGLAGRRVRVRAPLDYNDSGRIGFPDVVWLFDHPGPPPHLAELEAAGLVPRSQ